MKKVLNVGFVLVMCVSTVFAQKQKPPAKGSGQVGLTLNEAEIRRLSSVSEKELEAFSQTLKNNAMGQAKAAAKNIPGGIAEELLPDYQFKLPVLNAYAISKANAVGQDQVSLLTHLAKLKKALVTQIDQNSLKTLEAKNKSARADELEANGIALWYNNRQAASLYALINAVEKDPSNMLYWNNLGAYCSLSNLQAHAIPMLRFALKNSPNSTMLMNNLGQAYFGLGDVKSGRQYLEACLAKDPLNPEANRSMGMISLATGNQLKAVSHFSAEAQLAYRPTSMALLRNAGLEEKIQFSELIKKGNARNFSFEDTEEVPEEVIPASGPSHADFWNVADYNTTAKWANGHSVFNLMALNRIELPPFPKNVEQADELYAQHLEFQRKATAEMVFWMQRAGLNAKERSDRTHKTMMHADWAKATIDGMLLNDQPNLTLETQDWVNFITDWHTNRNFAMDAELKKVGAAGSSAEICAAKKRINDHYIQLMSGYLDNRHQILSARYKIYIDRLGQIASIEPTNAGYVYNAVYMYFSYMMSISAQVGELANLDHCIGSRKPAEDQPWNLDHLFEIICERGIGGTLPFGMVKAKLNCEGVSFSGSVELLKFGAEKKFKTGTTTLWVGGGLEASFKDVLEVEATQKLFVVWDKNNVCTDAGMSGTGKISVEHIGSSEFGYKFGATSGFNANVKTENDLGGNIEKVMGFIKH